MVRYLFYTIGDLTYQSPLVTNTIEESFHNESYLDKIWYRKWKDEHDYTTLTELDKTSQLKTSKGITL